MVPRCSKFRSQKCVTWGQNGSLGNSNWFPTRRNHAESAGSAAWFPDLVWLMDRNGRERSDWVGAPLHNIMRCHAVQYNIHQYYISYIYTDNFRYNTLSWNYSHSKEYRKQDTCIIYCNCINYINCVSRRKTQRFGSCWGSGAKAAPASSWVSSLRCHTSQPQPWLDESGWPMGGIKMNQLLYQYHPILDNTWSSRGSQNLWVKTVATVEIIGTIWNSWQSRDLIWKLVWLTWCGCFGVYLQYQQIRRIAFAAIIYPLV